MLKNKIFIAAAFGPALAASLAAGPAAWFSGKVLSGVQADGSGWDAPRYAGVTLVRHNIPGETAVQVAGPDADYPGMIFTGPHQVSYFLTDAGSQWPSGLAAAQKVLAVAETAAGKHGWQGAAYAGAVLGTIDKASMVAGMINLPDTWLKPIPAPALAQADPTHIQIQVGHFEDLGGQALNLALWRRQSGMAEWTFSASLANPAPGLVTPWTDSNVAPEGLYEYAIGVDFNWIGGSGAGARPLESGLYSTQARAPGPLMAASLLQPTATPSPVAELPSPTPAPLPEGWLAFPNPAYGEVLRLTFDAPEPGSYRMRAFNLAGEKSLEVSGTYDKKGRVTREAGIKHLAPGIYLVKLALQDTKGRLTELPTRKLAIIK